MPPAAPPPARAGTASDRRRRADAALARGDRHTGPRESAQQSRTLGYLVQVAPSAMARVDWIWSGWTGRPQTLAPEFLRAAHVRRVGPRVVRRPAAHDRAAAEGARRLKRKPA